MYMTPLHMYIKHAQEGHHKDEHTQHHDDELRAST